MKDATKIKALRSLLSTVVNNSKPHGKSDMDKERKQTKNVLEIMLNREPTEAELALATTF